MTRYRGVSAEKIAASILEKLGFEVIDWRRRVFIKGERVAEVDLVVKDKEGKEYCVEVKAGRIGASDIKHAYANAKILNMEPIIVGKGFADKSAEVLAEKLGVNVVKLSDYYVLLDLETLDKVVRESLREEVINAFTQILELLLNPPTRYLNVLEVIAESETLKQAAEKAKDEMAKLKADNELILKEARVERDKILKEAPIMRHFTVELEKI